MSGPLRVVVFGPARSGKTALAGLLGHHLAGRGVTLLDADGESAGRLLAGQTVPPLAAELQAADALVLVVDAAAPPEVVDQTFADFAGFLQRLEAGRSFGREVGGLPVVLTLAKCDALHRPADEPSDWLRRVEDRKAEMRERFEGRFADELALPADGYLQFGSLQLLLAATAKEVPPGPDFAGYADPGGSFGLTDLVGTLLPAAQDHADREVQTSRRLRRTAAGVGAIVVTLLAGLGAFGLAPAADPLAERVRQYQRREGPPAVRLAERAWRGTRAELAALEASPRFDRLPGDMQAFVRERLREADAYADFRHRFDPPRLGPAEVQTREQMDQLERDLTGPLAVPAEYAETWADTDAGKLAAKWRTDLALLQTAEQSAHEWYRGLIRRGDLLLLTDAPPDSAWRAAVVRLLAEAYPHPPATPLPASPTAPGPRGRPLTWAAALAVDRVAAARRDWDETAARLTALRAVCDAVGLTAADGPLAFPVPPPHDLAARVLPALPAGDEWKADRFPEPVRGVLAARLQAAFDAGVRGLQPAAVGGLDTPEVRAWGELLRRLAAWAGRPPVDPVRELAEFLSRDRFEIDFRKARLTLPDDLTDPSPVPAGPLTVTHTAGGAKQTYTLAPTGVPTRDRPNTVFRFAGPVVTVRPGDTLTATLPLRDGRELVWQAGTGPFAFLRLARPPRLGDAEATGVSLSAPGLAAPVLLPDPGGR